MATRTAVPTDVQTPTSLARSALSFAARCHAGQRRESDGAPFIEHPSEVARLLRDSGCSSDVVAAGILHKVVEDTDVSLAELTERFGAEIANLVQAVTDDSVGSYRERQQALRDRVDHAGGDVALLFAADKIAEVRELANQVRSERARFGANTREDRARDRLERFQQMRLDHCRESLRMLQRIAPRHPLVRQLATELHDCPIAGRRRRAMPPNPFDPDARAKEADA